MWCLREGKPLHPLRQEASRHRNDDRQLDELVGDVWLNPGVGEWANRREQTSLATSSSSGMGAPSCSVEISRAMPSSMSEAYHRRRHPSRRMSRPGRARIPHRQAPSRRSDATQPTAAGPGAPEDAEPAVNHRPREEVGPRGRAGGTAHDERPPPPSAKGGVAPPWRRPRVAARALASWAAAAASKAVATSWPDRRAGGPDLARSPAAVARAAGAPGGGGGGTTPSRGKAARTRASKNCPCAGSTHPPATDAALGLVRPAAHRGGPLPEARPPPVRRLTLP